MLWVICVTFCTLLVAGNHGVATKETFFDGSNMQELLTSAAGTIQKIDGITVTDTRDRKTNYNEGRQLQSESGKQSRGSLSAAGASYEERAHENVNAQDHKRRTDDQRRNSAVKVGDVGYERQQNRHLEEEERRRLALRRDHAAGAHVNAQGAGAYHSDKVALSAEEERRRRQKLQDKIKWSAGPSVSITQDKQSREDDHQRRRAQLASQDASAVHSSGGAAHSSSTQLSQDELRKRVRALNETRDLRAGEARLIHRKYHGKDSQRESGHRTRGGQHGFTGYEGHASHSKAASSNKEKGADSDDRRETLEISAPRVGIKERLGSGQKKQYERANQRVRESTAVAGVGTGALRVETSGASGRDKMRQSDKRYHDVGVHVARA